MKLDPRNVRFIPPFLPSGGSPRLAGRQNTLHLQETALVIEGEVLKQTMPFVDSLFQRALSGWTTITVPYSRIVEFRVLTRRVIRTLAILLAWLPTVLVLAPVFVLRARARSAEFLDALLPLFVSLVLTGLAWWFLAPVSRLTFRRADGRRVRIIFRIKSRKLREEFTALLESNRAAAAKVARHATGSRGDLATRSE